MLRPGYEVNSLSMTLLKLMCPGVPDFFQGSELHELRLVDPDNRQPVGFEIRKRLLKEVQSLAAKDVWARRAEGVAKMWLVTKTLRLRARLPRAFAGGYTPLQVTGAKPDNIVAALRGQDVIVVVPRFALTAGGKWDDTFLRFPGGGWRNEFTGETFASGLQPVADLFARFPVSLFVRDESQ
jgi:(1->4)-alpha-D-glucan 1-alpha-D-glucosylmutase